MQISSAWVDQASYPDVPSEIPVVRFDEAQRMIEASTGRATIGEPDLSPMDER
jgi:hypothetical protein